MTTDSYTADDEAVAETGLLDQVSTDIAETSGAYSISDAIGQQNISDLFSNQKLDEIAVTCLREYEQDESDFSTRKARIEDLYKLAMQVVEQKNYPFENSSNIKYPILTKAAIGFAAMAYPAIVKDSEVVKGKAIGNDDGDGVVTGPDGKPLIDEATGKEMVKNAGLKAKRAARVSTFMSHQVLEDMDGWENDTDKLLHIIPIIGCAFKKTFRDTGENKNASKLVLPQYLLLPITAKDIATTPRSSELIELYPHEIEENIRQGIFRAFDYHKISTETIADAYTSSGVTGGTESPSVSSVDPDKPHLFIEQHRRLDLDDDGYSEPYVVMLHKESRSVARIFARFDAATISGEIVGMDENDQPIYGDIKKIEAENFYEGFPFFPDPEGSPYGIGFGHLLQHLNEGINTSMNQLIDAGHRAIMGNGFIGTGFKIASGNLRFKPGEWKRIDTGGMSIRENAVALEMPEPSPTLLMLIQFLVKAAEDISMMNQVLNGQVPANMPATTMLASIEQGLQPFKAVFKRVHRALKGEFKRLFHLNRKYLTQEEYMSVLDDESANVETDFNEDDVDIVPVSDPDFVNDIQAMIRAQVLESYKDDPLVDQVEIRKRIFKAMKIADADGLVRIPPPVTDELVEAQKMALNAQANKLNNDDQRANIEMALKVETSMAEIILKAAQATKALAEAEATEGGPQMQEYMAMLDLLKMRMKSYADTAGRMGGVETAPDNAAVSKVPA